MKVSLTW